MTSSLRNSLHRRNHKERSQLAHRTKLGFLEKHKDYVKRARDYHSKQDRLNRLKQKAAERNKDEFYFSMKREKTRAGVHIKDRGNAAIPTDIVKVLKTQDENYVRTMRLSNLKKIDRLKRQLTEMADLFKSSLGGEDLEEDEYEVLQEAGILPPSGKKRGRSKSKHLVFAESLEEAQTLGQKAKTAAEPDHSSPPQEPEPTPEDLGWKTRDNKKKRRKTRQTIEELEDVDGEWEDEDDLTTHDSGSQSSTEKRTRLLKEISARLVRDRQLRYTQREFEMQRLLMGKGAAKKIAGVEKFGEDDDSEDDEDALDARGGRPLKKSKVVDEATYKPRVYKWKLERKR
ncbi:u3 small nucleolar RNA-associated protein 11 [Coprinopsis cinerea okayama7|uniref:U3 small nucleolar RNA-associated protein 11 n=1 Tax=Coprinopsis cinerea (strain Okayama-7 / 130 / ATCC MYA-4618 / FGSC 9003) TaxID=240176 RepID=A8N2E6_COPC7|nr:u3 small nucleolar RNA-associated protein 11 [Coprinopsis cinerea okayama7\|eukprot:XP_001829119.2 u3 small nucleolar RNA-associated protein 11 [Coprinopsis cinerea okayama7\